MTASVFVFDRPIKDNPNASAEERAYECAVAWLYELDAAGDPTSRAFVGFVEVSRRTFQRAGGRIAELVCPVCQAHLSDVARCVLCDTVWDFVPARRPLIFSSRELVTEEMCRLFGCEMTAIRTVTADVLRRAEIQ